MGLFGNMFKNKDVKESINDKIESFVVDDEIEFLLKVLSNLGILSIDKIKKNLGDNFNEELFNKLHIASTDDEFSSLKNYYGSYNLGYGEEKIELIHKEFKELSDKYIKEGKTKKEVIDKLIDITNKEIEFYHKVLVDLNDEIKTIESNNDNNETRIVVEFCIKKYKEKELGYSIDLESAVKDMANELVNLEYGGYGEDVVNQFVDEAKKNIEEDKNNNVSTNITLENITKELFEPKKKRFNSDLTSLNKKLDMIDASTFISDFEKEQNKLKTITEFQQMNGHTFSVDGTINRLKKNLSELDHGGYGEIVIDRFVDNCDEIIDKAREDGLSDKEIIKKIQNRYDKLIKDYEVHLTKLNEELSKTESDSIKDDLIEDFHDLMGHKVDYDKRLDKYKKDLENLEYGGYENKIVYDLINEAYEKIEILSSNDEISNYMKQVRRKYRDLMNEYNKELEKLNSEIEKIKDSKRKDESTINKEIDILVMSFKAKFGHSVDYKDIVENNVSDLKNLEQGGYGKKVLDEYRDYCDKVIEENDESDVIFKKIQNKYKDLKKNYTNNLKVFNEWRRLQLKSKSGAEKEELEKDLDTKITYMLSLSPEDLYDYYMEDDRKKKAEAYRHNYMAAYRYLAREEANKKKNKALYDRRLEELKEGKVIYSQKAIEEATKTLEVSTLNKEDIDEEDRIISLIEYIDSTLFRQMLYVESVLNIRNR